jgi:hypothetical protein
MVRSAKISFRPPDFNQRRYSTAFCEKFDQTLHPARKETWIYVVILTRSLELCILNIKRSKIPRSWTKVSPASAFLPVHKEPRLSGIHHSCHSKILPWMYDPYTKRTLFFLNVRHSWHSEILSWCTIRMQRYYPGAQSVCIKNTVLTRCLRYRSCHSETLPYVKIRFGKSVVLVRESGSVSKCNGSSTLAKRTPFFN